MEAEQNPDDSTDNSELVDSKQSVNTDNTVDKTESDKDQDEDTMKRDIVLRSGDGPLDDGEEQSKQKLQNQSGPVSENTSYLVDSAREDSDCSDYDGSSNCQLTNLSLRAKLLNSVINPINDRESKLRVSVFDHRIIPKKLIINKGNDNKNRVDTRDIDNENTLKLTKSQDNINERDKTNNSRKVTTLPSVLAANRKLSSNKESNSGSNGTENGSKMEGDYEIRTRFDILLRNLIGDVDGINVESSPVTVSSGYESDYIQTRTSLRDNNLSNKNDGSAVVSANTRTNGNTDNATINGATNNVSRVNSEDTPTDYFTMSETYPHDQVLQKQGAIEKQEFSSLPVLPTQSSETLPVPNTDHKEIPNIKPNTSSQSDRDFGFFYAQRQNYKLTKVTRSMYEIIHDLQNGEKGQTEGKKRSRKGRRPGQDSGSDGNNSSKDTLTHGRAQIGDSKSDNNTCNTTVNRTADANNTCVSGSVVRCVRRPQCSDSAPRPVVHRRYSQTEMEGRSAPAGTVNSDKLQNDLRNLLCDTSDVTTSSASLNDQLESFNMLSSNPNTRDGFTGAPTSTGDNGGNHPKVSINGEENRLIEGKRKPSLNDQFNNKAKPDDHVYETIPGDEKFYEEWKKMRTSMPKIRRFTTIPDLPGTFIPKEPPALPARKYLNNANQVSVSKKRELSDSNDNYIVMGDINSNFPNSDKSDSGYTTVSSDQMLVLREPQCFPYPIGNTSPSDNFGRHDETSDGYCSIDNLSLNREPIATPISTVTSSFPANKRSRDWRVPEPASVAPPPRLKRSDFFLNPQQHHLFQNGFSLFTNEHSSDMVTSPVVIERRQSRDSMDGSSILSPGFEPRTVKPSFQATYV